MTDRRVQEILDRERPGWEVVAPAVLFQRRSISGAAHRNTYAGAGEPEIQDGPRTVYIRPRGIPAEEAAAATKSVLIDEHGIIGLQG